MTHLVLRTSVIVADIPAVEAQYNATFVGDFCLKDSTGNWVNRPAAIFWQETPPVEGYSHYLALFVRDGKAYVTNGESAVSTDIIGHVARNGEIIYSRYRHDYRTSKDGSVTVDGGRDYARLIGQSSIDAPRVRLHIVGPLIEVHPT